MAILHETVNHLNEKLNVLDRLEDVHKESDPRRKQEMYFALVLDYAIEHFPMLIEDTFFTVNAALDWVNQNGTAEEKILIQLIRDSLNKPLMNEQNAQTLGSIIQLNGIKPLEQTEQLPIQMTQLLSIVRHILEIQKKENDGVYLVGLKELRSLVAEQQQFKNAHLERTPTITPLNAAAFSNFNPRVFLNIQQLVTIGSEDQGNILDIIQFNGFNQPLAAVVLPSANFGGTRLEMILDTLVVSAYRFAVQVINSSLNSIHPEYLGEGGAFQNWSILYPPFSNIAGKNIVSRTRSNLSLNNASRALITEAGLLMILPEIALRLSMLSLDGFVQDFQINPLNYLVYDVNELMKFIFEMITNTYNKKSGDAAQQLIQIINQMLAGESQLNLSNSTMRVQNSEQMTEFIGKLMEEE